MPNIHARDLSGNELAFNNEPPGNHLSGLGDNSKDILNPLAEVPSDPSSKSGNQQTQEPVQAAQSGVTYLVKPDPDLFSCSDGPLADVESSERILSRCSSQVQTWRS